jgi:hypothetical protein
MRQMGTLCELAQREIRDDLDLWPEIKQRVTRQPRAPAVNGRRLVVAAVLAGMLVVPLYGWWNSTAEVSAAGYWERQARLARAHPGARWSAITWLPRGRRATRAARWRPHSWRHGAGRTDAGAKRFERQTQRRLSAAMGRPRGCT